MTRTLTYAGKSLTDFACYWDASQVFRKPAKRVTNYAIPAHNGDYLVNDRTYDNVTIMFNCYIKDNYEQNYSDMVNYLNSFDTYQKLETSAEPSIYRMAMLHASIEPDTGQFLKDGQFTIEFDCKPQEFLLTGDTQISCTGTSITSTGNPVVIDNTHGSFRASSVYAEFEPSQDTSGSAPWAIDGKTSVTLANTNGLTTDTYTVQFHTGKNLLNYPVWKTDGITGGSATWSNYGVKLVSSGADCYTNYNNSTFPNDARIAVSEGDELIMSWELTGTASGTVYIFGNGTTDSMAQASASDRYLTYTVPSGVTYVSYRVGVSGNGNTLTYSNIMIRKSNTDGSFEPYGTTGLSTLYGGHFRPVEIGTSVYVTMDVIEYYNGQTIGEPWLSSLDLYVEGTTPTIGAKVVYTRATPVYYTISSDSFTILNGTNTLSTDGSSVEVTGYKPAEVVNPTYMEAQPTFVFTSGATVYVNGQRIGIGYGATFPVYVDTETMDAYRIVDGLRVSVNNYANLPDDLVKLHKGTNYVNSENSSSVKMIPRWWRL